MKHLLYYSKKVLEGDKDMLKLYMSYMYGNPKVSTSMKLQWQYQQLNIISFDNKPMITLMKIKK
jgi:hypothetical protein